jgi:hypothetical protein
VPPWDAGGGADDDDPFAAAAEGDWIEEEADAGQPPAVGSGGQAGVSEPSDAGQSDAGASDAGQSGTGDAEAPTAPEAEGQTPSAGKSQ